MLLKCQNTRGLNPNVHLPLILQAEYNPRMKKTLLGLLILCSLSSLAQQKKSLDQIQQILLKNNAKLEAVDVEQIKISDEYDSKSNGLHHVYFKQMHQGIEIFNATGSIHFNGDEAVVVHENFYHGLEPIQPSLGRWLTFDKAFDRAKVILQLETRQSAIMMEVEASDNEVTIHNKNYSDEPIVLTKYFLHKDGALIPVWNISIYTLSKSHWWNLRIDAFSGQFIEKNDWVTSCDFGETGVHNHAHTAAPETQEVLENQATNATSSYKALPLRVESPNHGNRTTIEDPDDSLASPYGWHDVNGSVGAEYTITRGNNVRARDDKDANNSGGTSPDGGSSLVFDHDFDKTKSATLYLDAAITNLFVWNNYMHDVWYHYGFDEDAGNFQANNYGRGSGAARANDQVNADAQDGSGTNNANFSTPPDGTSGRMQMFLWGGAANVQDLMRVHSPSGIAGTINGVPAGFGPSLTETPITEDLVLVDDGSSASSEGCNTLTNGSALNGKIALVDRGNCTFVIKVRNAQAAGAKAVVVINNLNGNPITMGGASTGINIPSIMISRADGIRLKNALQNGTVNVSLYDSSSTGTVWLDSDFDNGVIAHEYGHGISIRLSGGPSNSSCLTNQEQMGEGWSDFFALVMTQKIDAKGSDTRGVGTYLRGQATNGRGIRPFPYSTDMLVNPVTYDDIKASQFTAPHGVGSVWCTMLWDMYWAFIDKYGFDPDMYEGTGGNNIAMQLVIDGLKLQKCNPGFVDGRDAILEADKINNKGRNQALIWEVFARRGLGYSADQGSTNSKTDGTEAFDVSPFLDGMEFYKTAVARVKSTDTLTYTLMVKNVTDSTLRDVVVTDTLGSDLTFIEITSGQSYTEDQGIIRVTIDSIPESDSAVILLQTRLTSTSNHSMVEFSDDMEQDTGFWTKATDQGTGSFARVTVTANSGIYCWYISDPATQSDRSLIGEFDLNIDDPILTFYHFYNTEADWDGAVIEIDGGAGWEDLGHLMLMNGYNSTINTNQASNISNREAFSGNSKGFIETQIDLGNYQGKTVKIRFRMVSDGAQGGSGWFIDDVALYSGFVQVSNTAFARSENLRPLEATATTTILEGDKVSVLNLQKLNLQVFPNPSSSTFTIANPERLKGEYYLMDLNGKVLMNNKIDGKLERINATNLAEGVYLLKISAGEEFETIRIIKAKN